MASWHRPATCALMRGQSGVGLYLAFAGTECETVSWSEQQTERANFSVDCRPTSSAGCRAFGHYRNRDSPPVTSLSAAMVLSTLGRANRS